MEPSRAPLEAKQVSVNRGGVRAQDACSDAHIRVRGRTQSLSVRSSIHHSERAPHNTTRTHTRRSLPKPSLAQSMHRACASFCKCTAVALAMDPMHSKERESDARTLLWPCAQASKYWCSMPSTRAQSATELPPSTLTRTALGARSSDDQLLLVRPCATLHTSAYRAQRSLRAVFMCANTRTSCLRAMSTHEQAATDNNNSSSSVQEQCKKAASVHKRADARHSSDMRQS